MGIENLMLTVHRVPEIKAVVDTGTDWVTLFGFLLTAIAVVAGSFYNSYTFKKTIASQEKIAEQNQAILRGQSRNDAIVKSVQEGINRLRDDVANVLALGHDIYALAQFIVDASWVRSSVQGEFEKNKADYGLKYADFADKLARSRFYYAKIELYLDPKDVRSNELLGSLLSYINAASVYTRIVDIGIEVVAKAQFVLKSEEAKLMAVS